MLKARTAIEGNDVPLNALLEQLGVYMSEGRWTKARWIAKQLDENVDDVYDVLLGNITTPWSLYQGVESMSREYDAIVARAFEKDGE